MSCNLSGLRLRSVLDILTADALTPYQPLVEMLAHTLATEAKIDAIGLGIWRFLAHGLGGEAGRERSVLMGAAGVSIAAGARVLTGLLVATDTRTGSAWLRRATPEWRELMAFEIARTRRYYESADLGTLARAKASASGLAYLGPTGLAEE